LNNALQSYWTCPPKHLEGKSQNKKQGSVNAVNRQICINPMGILDRPFAAKIARRLTGYLFVAPAVLFLTAITAYPILNALWMSVTEYLIGNNEHPFVGLRYYSRLISDERLWNSVKNSFFLGFFGCVITILIGIGLALLLNSNWAPLRLRELMRGIFIMPWIVSTTLAALMWGLMLHREGIINSYLTRFGLLERPIAFTGNITFALPVIIGIFIWKVYPFAMVMVLSALKSVPDELYDAAKVDGANSWQRVKYVSLPLVMPVLLTVSILVFIWGFGHYDLVRVITGGGPIHHSEVVSFYLYDVAFLETKFSYGAAISILVFIILILFGLLYVRVYTRSKPWG
jgi:multiple sugar transport system permease protein